MKELRKICEIISVPPNNTEWLLNMLRKFDDTIFVVETEYDDKGVHWIVMRDMNQGGE